MLKETDRRHLPGAYLLHNAGPSADLPRAELIKSDVALQSELITASRSGEVQTRYDAVRNLQCLPINQAVPELLYQIAEAKDERIQGEGLFGPEFPFHTLAASCLRDLIKVAPEELKAFKLQEASLPPSLHECTDLKSALERLVDRLISDPERKRWESGALSQLIDGLYELDQKQGLTALERAIREGPRNVYGYRALLEIVADRELASVAPTILDAMAAGPHYSHDNDGISIMTLGKLGFTTAEVGRMLSERPITRNLDDWFLRHIYDLQMPVSVQILEAAIKQQSTFIYPIERLIRLAQKRETQLELEPEHVHLIFGLVANKQRAFNPGNDSTIGKEAVTTLEEWLKGPSAALVARVLDTIERDSRPPKGSVKRAALNTLSKYREGLARKPEVEDLVGLEPRMALDHLLFVIRPPPDILQTYLSSFAKPDDDLTPEDKEAREYIVVLAKNNYDSLSSIFRGDQWSQEKATQLATQYRSQRDFFDEADDYRWPEDRPLQRIVTVAAGLLCPEVRLSSVIGIELSREFEQAKQTFDRFNTEYIALTHFAPLVGSLVRLGQIDQALGYLDKYKISDFGALYRVVDTALLKAREEIAEGTAKKALEYLKCAENFARAMPKFERQEVLEQIERDRHALFSN